MVASVLSARTQRTSWRQEALPAEFNTARTKQTGFAVQAARYSETFQLNLTTREGDRVSVNFRQMLMGLSAQREYSETAQRGRDVAFVSSHKALEAGAFEARFGLHVQGNLNEEERKALKNIFQQIAKLADAFYGGNMQCTTQAAQQLTADPEQIAGMKLSMSQTYTRLSMQHQAVAFYRETAQQTQGPHPLKAAQQVQRYWQQVQAAIQQTFRQFSLLSSSWVAEISARSP